MYLVVSVSSKQTCLPATAMAKCKNMDLSEVNHQTNTSIMDLHSHNDVCSDAFIKSVQEVEHEILNVASVGKECHEIQC